MVKSGLLLHSLVHTQACLPARVHSRGPRPPRQRVVLGAPRVGSPRETRLGGSAVAERGDGRAREGAARERGASEERGDGSREARAVATGVDDAVERKSRRRRLEDGRGRAQQALALHRARRAQVVMPMPDANTRLLFPFHFCTIQSRIYSKCVIYAFSTLMNSIIWHGGQMSRPCVSACRGRARKRPVIVPIRSSPRATHNTRVPGDPLLGPSRTMADVEPATADPPPPVGSLVRVRPSTARLSSSATSPMSVSTSDLSAL